MTSASSTAGGTGGGGGSGGGTGAGGSSPSANPVAYLPLDFGARLCSRVFKCPELAESIGISLGVPIDPMNYSECITWVSGPVPDSRRGLAEQAKTLECVAAASNCKYAAQCLPHQVVSPDDPTCSDSGTKCINNSTAIDCDNLLISNCSSAGFDPGSQCTDDSNQSACTKGACDSPGEASCDGTTLVTCSKAGLTRASCITAGLTCVPEGAGAACEGLGACGTPGAASCKGNDVEACNGAWSSLFDCSAMGASCVSIGAARAHCELPGAQCTPGSDSVNVCTGNKSITICVGGQVKDIPCPIGKCQDASGGRTAYCG